MAYNEQTNPFPPTVTSIEQSWSQNVRASLDLLAPGEGIRSGLELGIPLSSGQPTSGLTPTLTDGYLVKGDHVLGPYSGNVVAVDASQAMEKVYFGLRGMNTGDDSNAPLNANDVMIGQVTTSADSISAIGQQYNYGACRFGIRGLVAIPSATVGADTPFFVWTVPDIGLKNVRIVYAQTRMAAVVTGGNDAGDDFVLKVQEDSESAIALVTIDDAELDTAAGITRNVSADGDALSFYDPTTLSFEYNLTDTNADLAGGLVECNVLLEVF